MAEYANLGGGNLYYKLSEAELDLLATKGLLTPEQVAQVKAQSLAREPGTFDRQPLRFWLNKAQSIYVQSIHYYGGEHFGKPHHFLAEIGHCTTHSHLSGFMHRNGLDPIFDRIPFTY